MSLCSHLGNLHSQMSAAPTAPTSEEAMHRTHFFSTPILTRF
jgi:hypothetical protein